MNFRMFVEVFMLAAGAAALGMDLKTTPEKKIPVRRTIAMKPGQEVPASPFSPPRRSPSSGRPTTPKSLTYEAFLAFFDCISKAVLNQNVFEMKATLAEGAKYAGVPLTPKMLQRALMVPIELPRRVDCTHLPFFVGSHNTDSTSANPAVETDWTIIEFVAQTRNMALLLPILLKLNPADMVAELIKERPTDAIPEGTLVHWALANRQFSCLWEIVSTIRNDEKLLLEYQKVREKVNSQGKVPLDYVANENIGVPGGTRIHARQWFWDWLLINDYFLDEAIHDGCIRPEITDN